MKEEKMTTDYLMSYTAAGLMYPESLAIAEAYVKTYDWEKTWEQIRTDNLMQKRSQASIKRQRWELVKRLKKLNDLEIEELVAADPDRQREMLWFAVRRTYPFIDEICSELLPEKAASSDPFITSSDLRVFYDQKSLENEKLRDYTESTRKKLISNAMTLMRQAGIIGENGSIRI